MTRTRTFEARLPNGDSSVRPLTCLLRYDPDGDIYIRCDCGAQRYVREAPMTECTKCGTWMTFYVKRGL